MAKIVKRYNKQKYTLAKNKKLQSAMEYLMTYGWAILIIAIVLVALYALGVFNSTNFAPKASPGSCQVFRPYGPGTSQDLNLEGICNGEMPQYVADFIGKPEEGIKIPLYTTNFTVSVWFYDDNPAGTYYGGGPGVIWSTPIFDIYDASVNNGVGGNQGEDFFGLGADNGEEMTIGENYYTTPTGSISPYTWENVIISVKNYDYINISINGNLTYIYTSASGASALNALTNPTLSLASNPPGGDEISSNIWISNVQIYNTALSSNNMKILYQEGIGGAPFDLQNLIGWWPLNGNVNDYSGNNNNGGESENFYNGGPSFISSWYSGYTKP
jgi:hypothetical protein